MTSTRKFGREVQAWDVGTASFVLDNTKRYFSPSNLSASSPYVTGGISQIRPLRPMRWSATYQGVTYYGYTGYSTAWEETFLPGMVDAYVTVPCEDEMAMIAAFDGLELTPVGAGELSGVRIHRILDNAHNTATRAIETGRVTMQATTLAQNAATEIKLVADSEGGALFVDGDGTLVYEGQYALLENARSNTVQGTFSTAATATCRAGTSRSTTAATWCATSPRSLASAVPRRSPMTRRRAACTRTAGRPAPTWCARPTRRRSRWPPSTSSGSSSPSSG
jgi:hypothetical protein